MHPRSVWGLRGNSRYRPTRVKSSSGFTIIEIMLVIGIMSILMALAIAAYSDYTKRTRMVEVMLAAGSCRTPIGEAYYFGRRPKPGGWGCESVTGWSKLVKSIDVGEDGLVTVTARGFADEDIDDKALTLMPLVDGQPAKLPDDKGKKVEWRCGDSGDGTTIKAEYLPRGCR